MSQAAILLIAAVYIALGRVLVRLRARGVRLSDPAFALLNLAIVYLFFFWGKDARFRMLFTLFFAGYVAMVSVQYLTLRLWAQRAGKWPWLAFYTPILFLVLVRYAPVTSIAKLFSRSIYEVLLRHPEFNLNWVLAGISYLVFRTSHLVLEVRNGVVPRPSFSQYLSFAFLAPTLSVGPINPYSVHQRGFASDQKPDLPIGRCLLRILVGAVKFRFFGPLLNTLTYGGLLLDGHPHHWIDLPVAIFAYYLYLYANFSGFCDIAIGAAGLMGIPVSENFNNPFRARNMKEFWNRWHITLSNWMRDVVFAPVSKTLVRWFGPARMNHAIAATILIVFLIVGVWHGVGWNYAVYGVANAIGVAGNHYYTIWLKKRLGKDGFAKYNKSRVIEAVAVAMTFTYAATILIFFANSFGEMKTIFTMIRW